MSQIKKASQSARFIFTSPWFLLVFLIIPALTVANHLLHRSYHQNLLLINNCGFLICIFLRLCWYLMGLMRGCRYGASQGQPKNAHELNSSAAELREKFSGMGYVFANNGWYGEKRDHGYLGMPLLYAGLFLTLFFGCYDNLRQFSGVVVTGIGNAVPLNDYGNYIEAPVLGPFAAPEALPQLQIKQMIVSDPKWPNGAVRIGLIGDDGIELTDGFVTPGKSLHYRDYEFRLVRFKFRAAIAVTQGEEKLYSGILNFYPLPVKQKGFDFYAGIIPSNPDDKVTGDAWYNPETRSMRLIVAKNGKQIIDSTLQMYVKVKDKQGEYDIRFVSLGEAPQIQVVRSRHMFLIAIGAIIAIFGGFLRLIFRPQRLWLEEAAVGCRARGIGRQTLKLIESL